MKEFPAPTVTRTYADSLKYRRLVYATLDKVATADSLRAVMDVHEDIDGTCEECRRPAPCRTVEALYEVLRPRY